MSTSNGTKELTGYSLEQTDKWDNNTKVSHGKKYIKVVQENGVFVLSQKKTLNILKIVILAWLQCSRL